MAFKRLRLIVDSGIVVTSSTAQITVGSQDISALPGGDAFVSRGAFSIQSMVYVLENGGGHASVIYQKVVGGAWNAGGGFFIGTGANANSATNGVILGSTSFGAAITYDTLGTVWRCRVTPPSSTNYHWYAVHSVEYVEYQ